jgi:hypothetical protein
MKTKRKRSRVMYDTLDIDSATVDSSTRSDGMLFASFSTRSRRNDRNTDVEPDLPPAASE